MLKIKVKKRDINRALKEYKSKIIKTRQMRELNDNRYHTKDSERKRKDRKKAIYVQKKFKNDDY